MDTRDALERVSVTAGALGVHDEGAPRWAERASALLEQQHAAWPALRNGYNSLKDVQTRLFRFDACQVRVQFNPGRLTSSSARVDEQSIRERKCFLCLPHLPAEQRGILYGAGYMILCNPFPIFPEHFTIPRIDHVPQRIAGEVGTFLDLARDLAPRYTLFYNGPRSGASAPDHMHFQAGLRGFMPIEGEIAALLAASGLRLLEDEGLEVSAVDSCVRRFVVCVGRTKTKIEEAILGYLHAVGKEVAEPDEPMVNIVAWSTDGVWTVLVFPRTKHRPSFFHAEGERRLLISPAAVDMCGVTVTPLEEDFRKVTADHLQTMYEEIGLSRQSFARTIDRFRRSAGAT